MSLPVRKRFSDDAGIAFFLTMSVDSVTFLTVVIPESFPPQAVGLDDIQVAILHGYVTGRFLEKLPVSVATLVELILKAFEPGYIRRHLDYFRNRTVVITDRGRINQDGNLLVFEGLYRLFTVVPLPVMERQFHRANLALLRPVLINLVTIATLVIPEILAEGVVGLDYPELTILHGQIPRDGVDDLVRVSTARVLCLSFRRRHE
jgi:hypothetical protein